MPDLLTYRDQFDSLKNCHHLISNSLGAMPNGAAEMAARYTTLWAERGVRSWEEEWWLLGQVVGNKIGTLMNAAPDSVSMQANVTSAQAIALSCFDFSGTRNKAVMVDAEFPSMLYLYKSQVEPAGRLHIVECGPGPELPLEKILEAIDEKTALVNISLVFFRSSYLIDAKAVIEKAHSVGAKVIVDVFQALGTVPVDITALNADFACGGCLKWLCGGAGACYLYVRPDLGDKLTPTFTGWMAHENPFAFDNSGMKFTSGSYRFLNGTPIIPAQYICQPGLDVITEVGVDRIREHSLKLTSRVIKLAEERGWPIFAPLSDNNRGGTVALSIDNAQPISNELLKRNYLVDFRPGAGLRVSPHFYNTESEIDDLFEQLDQITKSKS